MREPTPSVRARTWASFVLLAGFAGAVAVSAWQALRAPHDVDASAYVRALSAARGRLRAGDRVLVQPPWRLDVLDALDQAQEVPRGVEVGVALSRAHAAPLGRLLVLQDPGWPLPRALERALEGADTLDETLPLRVLWHAPAPFAGGDDAETNEWSSRLAEADVWVETADGQRIECAYRASAARHVCPGLPSWMYVGPQRVRVAGNDETCIWTHPISGGRVVTRFSGVPLPKAWELSGALSDQAAGLATGATVTLALRVAAHDVLRLERQHDKGFATARARPRAAAPESADVEVIVSTSDDRMRHFCWRLRAGEPSP